MGCSESHPPLSPSIPAVGHTGDGETIKHRICTTSLPPGQPPLAHQPAAPLFLPRDHAAAISTHSASGPIDPAHRVFLAGRRRPLPSLSPPQKIPSAASQQDTAANPGFKNTQTSDPRFGKNGPVPSPNSETQITPGSWVVVVSVVVARIDATRHGPKSPPASAAWPHPIPAPLTDLTPGPPPSLLRLP